MANHPRRLAPEATLKSPIKSPTPSHVHGLFLSKPLLGNGSRVSLNDMGHPAPPHTPTGIRAQLGHLLPRHADFRARVQIHQINNVPLVSGEFGVRWKFKNVQSHASTGPKGGLLDRVKARAEKRKQPQDDKGKRRVQDEDSEGSTPKHKLQELLEDKPPAGPGGAYPAKINTLPSNQSSIVSESLRSQSISSELTSSSSITTDTLASSTTTVFVDSISSDLSATAATLATSTQPPTSSPPFSITPARGMAHFHKLREHAVTWNKTLDTIIKFDIDRETSQVLPCPLKLVVMQRVIPDDPDGPVQNPRLGAVYLNLAEYIDKGSVERRYLLKESKTNAMLRLTIDLEYISGETHYIPPPLPKEEIMAGLANYLNNDAVKKRPRALDLYGPYRDQEELEIDLLGMSKSARLPKTARTAKSARLPSDSTGGHPAESGTEDEDGLLGDDREEDEAGVLGEEVEYMEAETDILFDVQRLPLAYGTRTTETLIEAIFNPVKITDPRKESPFTLYQGPPSPVDQPFSGKTVRGYPPGFESPPVGLGLIGIPGTPGTGTGMTNLTTARGMPPPPPIPYTRRETRQDSMTSEEFGSLYETTSSSAASVQTDSGSSRSRSQSKDFGYGVGLNNTTSTTSPKVKQKGSKAGSRPSTGHGAGGSIGGASGPSSPSASSHGHESVVGVSAKSTPGGRVVVTSVEHPVLSGIKGWWKRHTHTHAHNQQQLSTPVASGGARSGTVTPTPPPPTTPTPMPVATPGKL